MAAVDLAKETPLRLRVRRALLGLAGWIGAWMVVFQLGTDVIERLMPGAQVRGFGALIGFVGIMLLAPFGLLGSIVVVMVTRKIWLFIACGALVGLISSMLPLVIWERLFGTSS